MMGVHCTSACPKHTWERISSVACSLRIALEAFLAILKEGMGEDELTQTVPGLDLPSYLEEKEACGFIHSGIPSQPRIHGPEKH